MTKRLTIRVSGERASGKTLVLNGLSKVFKLAGYETLGNLVQSGNTEEMVFEGLPKNLAGVVTREPSTLEHNLANALDTFWNSALGALAETENQDSSAMMTVSAIVQGVAAVASELRQSVNIPQDAAVADMIDKIKGAMRNGGLPAGHTIIEQADMQDGSGLVAQTVVIDETAKEYVRMVHMDEAYGV